MPTTTSYLARVQPAIDEVGERLAALAAAASDPDARLARSDWTVRQGAAHLVTVVPRYADGPEGRGTWVPDRRQLAALNDAQLHALGALSMAELAGQLRRHLATLRTQLQGYGDSVPAFRFHGGEPVAADLALGILLAELTVHGFDIARALARPWPIDPGHVELIFQGLDPIAPGWVDPVRTRRLTATFQVHLRGERTHVYAFRDGRLQVNPAARTGPTSTSRPTRPPSCSSCTGGNPNGGTSPPDGCSPGAASPGSPPPWPAASSGPRRIAGMAPPRRRSSSS